MRWQLFPDHDDGAAEGPDEDPGPLPDSDAAFWASPAGMAARAKLRGDRFFQVELDDATLSEYAETSAPGQGRRARRTCDLLGQIEELGWHLEHVTWWRVDTAEAAPGGHAAPPGPGGDHVSGVYLFHAVPAETSGGPASALAGGPGMHAPTHRRELPRAR